MRSFIAIALPALVRDYIGKLQGTLRDAGADVKWVEPENAHLTLKFLGEIDEQTAETVKEAMREACEAMPPFAIKLTSLGAFPDASNPRVIWIGISAGAQQATTVAGRLEERLALLGLKEERSFTAHITIGRTRSSKNRKELSAALQAASILETPAPFPVNAVTLFQSKLSPKGPTYISLFEAVLK
jgi:RNA 2',3'-cyclic 3'-phosphodiesterase